MESGWGYPTSAGFPLSVPEPDTERPNPITINAEN